jgi:hypothetical protein
MPVPVTRRLLAVALAGAGLAAAAPAAPASAAGHPAERLVVRGTSTIVDSPCGPAGCPLQMSGGAFRGTLGSGAYAGDLTLDVARAFDNGEDGLCAPIRGRIVLGAGTPDRLVLTVAGDSCQDGAGPLTQASFTGLARFAVKSGTGTYAGARGAGVAVFAEDAADQDRMTLIGRIKVRH